MCSISCSVRTFYLLGSRYLRSSPPPATRTQCNRDVPILQIFTSYLVNQNSLARPVFTPTLPPSVRLWPRLSRALRQHNARHLFGTNSGWTISRLVLCVHLPLFPGNNAASGHCCCESDGDPEKQDITVMLLCCIDYLIEKQSVRPSPVYMNMLLSVALVQ